MYRRLPNRAQCKALNSSGRHAALPRRGEFLVRGSERTIPRHPGKSLVEEMGDPRPPLTLSGEVGAWWASHV
jgi:hypothetical protein